MDNGSSLDFLYLSILLDNGSSSEYVGFVVFIIKNDNLKVI